MKRDVYKKILEKPSPLTRNVDSGLHLQIQVKIQIPCCHLSLTQPVVGDIDVVGGIGKGPTLFLYISDFWCVVKQDNGTKVKITRISYPTIKQIVSRFTDSLPILPVLLDEVSFHDTWGLTRRVRRRSNPLHQGPKGILGIKIGIYRNPRDLGEEEFKSVYSRRCNMNFITFRLSLLLHCLDQSFVYRS